ncbi:DUF4145 domain-containing protein [Cognatilysobacter bugurensis]|uniref:DUF4145 domain-containing protein n=1 Tax=Cognatilysobacter bugurensis TaxID=543356 RepID=A0A918W649_9GAMM|nr:DUF4145 domain-containing protein [Lysobacter bugurensis]GHA76608.1 hypothetical protein GCM10007067_12340 [Lysobacter bugurensis]
MDKSSVSAKATAESVAAQDHPAWDPDWQRLRFVAMAQCDNLSCMEVATLKGTGGLQPIGRSFDYEEFYTPEHFDPSPLLIGVPKKCSEDVCSELHLAFASAWGDAAAASAHIRTAVERLLDQLRVPKSAVAKGKRQRHTLHRRIELLAKQHPEAGDLLLAVKWIGNAGVHSGALTKAEVMDALDILESALTLLFNDHHKKVRKLAKRINSRRGP